MTRMRPRMSRPLLQLRNLLLSLQRRPNHPRPDQPRLATRSTLLALEEKSKLTKVKRRLSRRLSRRAKPELFCSLTQRRARLAVRQIIIRLALQIHTDSCPGTTQACLFRDSFTPLTASGLSIFGLSRDSPKSNTTFKTKQELPYALLCDKAATLIAAIGFKNGDKTQRGVFVVKKDGQVLAAEPGGPAATVDVVKGLVANMGGASIEDKQNLEQAEARATAAEADEVKPDQKKKREKKAKAQTPGEVAAEVADTASRL